MANKRKDHPVASDDDDDETRLLQLMIDAAGCPDFVIQSIRMQLEYDEERKKRLNDSKNQRRENKMDGNKRHKSSNQRTNGRDEEIYSKLGELADFRRCDPSLLLSTDFKLWIHYCSDPKVSVVKNNLQPYGLSLTGPCDPEFSTQGSWDGQFKKPSTLDRWFDSWVVIQCPVRDRIWLHISFAEWTNDIFRSLGETFIPTPVQELIWDYWGERPAKKIARIQEMQMGIGPSWMSLDLYDTDDRKLMTSNPEDSSDAIFVEYNPRLVIDISADYPPVQYYRPIIQL
jgi:hypothetical protein